MECKKNVTILAQGRGLYRCIKLQRRAKNTGAWTHGDTEQREGHQQNDDNIRWFSVEATLGKRVHIQLRIFPYTFRFSPRFSLYWDSRENIQENIGAKKSVLGLLFPYATGERQRIAKEKMQFKLETKHDKSDGNSQRIHRLKSRNNPLLLANRGNTILDEF